MSKRLLISLDEANSFSPDPGRRFGDLAPYHVQIGPYVEPIIKAALSRCEPVAISGQIGTGKSSALEYACSQIPNLAVMWVPAREQPIEVLKDPGKFAAYLVQVIGDFARRHEAISDEDFKGILGKAGTRVKRTPKTVKASKSAGVNKWLTLGLQREVTRVLDEEAVDLDRPTERIYEVVSRILDTIRHYEFEPRLIPCLIIDDQDHWFARGTEEAKDAYASFFGRIIPQLTRLDGSLAIAIHTIYTEDPSLQGFRRVPIPMRLGGEKLVEIVERRLEISAGRHIPINGVFEEGAFELLCRFYQELDAPNLREFLLVCGYALEIAVRSGKSLIALNAASEGVELQRATRLARELPVPDDDKSPLALPPGRS